MAEPQTTWGRDGRPSAVADIRDLKAGIAGLDRRVESLEGKVDALRAEFAEFRGTVRGIGDTICVLITVFGALATAGGAWVAKTVVEHEVELSRLPSAGGEGR